MKQEKHFLSNNKYIIRPNFQSKWVKSITIASKKILHDYFKKFIGY